jgi:tetratricopeptide (TPR) repeat protein
MHESKKTVLFDRLAAYVLIVVLGLSPLFFIPFVGVSVDVSKTYFLAFGAMLALVLWMIARMIEGTIYVPKSPVIVAAALIPAAFLISALFSPASQISLGGLFIANTTVAGMFVSVLLFIGSVFYIHSEKRLQLLGKIALIVTAIITVFQVAYLIVGPKFLSFGIFFSSVSNVVGKWNDLAIWYAAVVIGIIISFEFLQFSKIQKILISIVLATSLAFLILINFALVWGLIAFFSLMLFVYSLTILRKDGEEGKHHFPLAAFIVLIVSLFFFLANPIAGGYVAQKIGISQTEVRPSIGSTAQVVLASLKNHLIVGVGPDRFASAWFLYHPKEVTATQFWDTTFASGSGFLPTLVATTGLLGTLPLLAFLILFLLIGFFHVFKNGYERKTHFYLLASFSLSVFSWIIALIYNPGVVSVAFAFALSGIFIGVLNGTGRVAVKEFNFLKDPRHSFFAILLLVVVMLGSLYVIFTGGEKFASILFYSRAQSAANNNNIVAASNFVNESIALYPSDTYYRSQSTIQLAQINQLLSSTKLSADIIKSEFQTAFTAAEQSARNAIAYDQTNPTNWMNLASLYQAVLPLGVSGSYDNAKAALDQAAKYEPLSPGIDLLRAKLALANKDHAGAKAALQAALVKKPNYIDAIFLLAQIEAADGDTATALSQLEQTALANPRDASVYLELGLFKYDAKDYLGAVSALERSITLDSSSVNSHYYLGLAYAKVGRTDDAKAIFNSLVKALPNNTDLPKIVANLNAGKDPLDGFPTAAAQTSVGDTTSGAAPSASTTPTTGTTVPSKTTPKPTTPIKAKTK